MRQKIRWVKLARTREKIASRLGNKRKGKRKWEEEGARNGFLVERADVFPEKLIFLTVMKILIEKTLKGILRSGSK